MSAVELVILVQGLTILLVAVAAWTTPVVTRPDLYFAVTVVPAFRSTAEGLAIRRRYRWEVVVHALIGGALAAGGTLAGENIFTGVHPLVAMRLGANAGLLWLIGGWFVAFLRARHRVLPHAAAPTTVREAATSPRETGLPGGWPAQLLPLAVLGATAVYLHLHWLELPARFPVHWGMDGRPNRWADRTLAGVYGPLWIGALMVGALGLLAWMMARGTRPVRPDGAAGAAERRFRRGVLGVVLGAQVLLGLSFTWVALLPLHGAGVAAPVGGVAGAAGGAGGAMPVGVIASMIVSLVFAAGVTIFLLRMGQGGTRSAGAAGREVGAGGAPVGDRSPDRCWKAGIFYVNPDDPALFVEKRFGVGYTLNFARPAAWLLMILLILVLPAVALWIARAGS